MCKKFKSFYFKSKVLLIDDNESFLENLNYKLSDKYLIDTYENPSKALESILANYSKNILANTSNLINEIDDEEDNEYYSIDFTKIKELSEAVNKNEVISVIVVDYSMPLMNGIEFCKKIAHLPVLKIMLTGHADFKLAVDSFNQGVIDKFLVKDTKFMLEEIKNTIDIMQDLFFERLSYPLLNCFLSKQDTLITSTGYLSHFQKIINELDIVEYFLLNQHGSYLLNGKNGSKYYFMTLLDKQLEEYIEIAKSLNCTPDIINKMLNRTHAPFFLNETQYKLPISAWDFLLQPLQHANGYHYCIIKLPN